MSGSTPPRGVVLSNEEASQLVAWLKEIEEYARKVRQAIEKSEVNY